MTNMGKRMSAALAAMLLLASAALTGCGTTTVTEDSSTVVITGATKDRSSSDAETSGGSGSNETQGGGTDANGTKGNTATTTRGNTNNSGSTVDKTDVKNYTFTIMSPWLMRSEKDAVTEYEKTFWTKINKIQKNEKCTIKIVAGNLPTIDHLRAQIMSGSKVADIVHVKAEETLGLAAAGYITPWNKVSGINTGDSRWVASYTKLGSVGSDVYGLNWMRAPEARMCVIVNKTLLKDSGVNEDLYSLVDAKKWTWSKLQEMAKQVTVKHTSNNRTTAYGVGGWYQEIARALWISNGAALATYANGKAAAGYTSARMAEAINFMNTLVNTDKSFNATNYRDSKTFNSTDNGDSRSAFLDGKLAFMFEETWFVNQYLKPANPKFEYGIVPVPIGPSESNYRTDAGTAGVFVCTSTNAASNTIAKTVKILNLLAEPEKGYEGESWWEYDLKKEYFQSGSADKDLKMYKLCLDTAVADYGVTVNTLYNQFDRKVVQGAVFLGESSVSSAIQSLGTTYDKAISSMFTFKK